MPARHGSTPTGPRTIWCAPSTSSSGTSGDLPHPQRSTNAPRPRLWPTMATGRWRSTGSTGVAQHIFMRRSGPLATVGRVTAPPCGRPRRRRARPPLTPRIPIRSGDGPAILDRAASPRPTRRDPGAWRHGQRASTASARVAEVRSLHVASCPAGSAPHRPARSALPSVHRRRSRNHVGPAPAPSGGAVTRAARSRRDRSSERAIVGPAIRSSPGRRGEHSAVTQATRPRS